MTSHGVVVLLENHNNGAGNAGGRSGSVFTGSQLSSESQWYASIAAAFKGNPRVWYATNNEPPDGDKVGLARWQLATYNAIRSTGNLAPILLETAGNPDSINVGLPQDVYSQMSNTAWDLHDYGWTANFSTNQSDVDAALARMVRSAQLIRSSGGIIMPVLVLEYGDSTTGAAIDPNGDQNVKAVHTSTDIAGSAAWAHAQGGPGDGLLAGGGLSKYGQTVAAYIASADKGGSTICAPTQAATTVVSVTAPAEEVPAATEVAPLADAVPMTVEQAQAWVAQLQADLEKAQ
jgi:hypothetical protein